MFPIKRQNQLDPVLAKLREVPGITQVQQDDFNSVAIDVFLELEDEGQMSGRFGPYSFVHPIRSVKAKIKEACEGVEFLFLHQPVKRYESNGKDYPKHDLGYDSDHIKLEIQV